MKQVNIHEAKTHLSKLVQMALDGEEVVIAKANRPLVRLTLHESVLKQQRRPGRIADLIQEMSDDFDAPLDDFADYMP